MLCASMRSLFTFSEHAQFNVPLAIASRYTRDHFGEE